MSISANQTCNSWETLGCKLEIYFLDFLSCGAVVNVVLGVRHPMKYKSFPTLVPLLVEVHSSLLHMLLIGKKGGKRAVSSSVAYHPLELVEHFRMCPQNIQLSVCGIVIISGHFECSSTSTRYLSPSIILVKPMYSRDHSRSGMSSEATI